MIRDGWTPLPSNEREVLARVLLRSMMDGTQGVDPSLLPGLGDLMNIEEAGVAPAAEQLWNQSLIDMAQARKADDDDTSWLGSGQFTLQLGAAPGVTLEMSFQTSDGAGNTVCDENTQAIQLGPEESRCRLVRISESGYTGWFVGSGPQASARSLVFHGRRFRVITAGHSWFLATRGSIEGPFAGLAEVERHASAEPGEATTDAIPARDGPGGVTTSQDLDQIYRDATYTVSTPQGEVQIRIGEQHPSLDARLQSALPSGSPRCWALITAHNPRSRPLSPHENAARGLRLREELSALGTLLAEGHDRELLMLPAEGASPDRAWVEDSVWIAGLTALEALALGARFGQNAVVTGEAGREASLRWVLVRQPSHGVRADRIAHHGGANGAAAVAALRRIHDALDSDSAIDADTLRAASRRWAEALDAAGRHPAELGLLDLAECAGDLEAIARLETMLDGPTGSRVRVFSVHWPDGPELCVASEFSEAAGEPLQRDLSLGLTDRDAVDCLNAGSARVCLVPSDVDVRVSSRELAACIDAL